VRSAKPLDVPADGNELSQSFATDLRKFAASILFPDAGKRVRYRFVRNFRNFRGLPEEVFPSLLVLRVGAASASAGPLRKLRNTCSPRASRSRCAPGVEPGQRQGRLAPTASRCSPAARQRHCAVVHACARPRWVPMAVEADLATRTAQGWLLRAGRSNHPSQLHDQGLRLEKATTSRTMFLVM
jgi:hypothetical protein